MKAERYDAPKIGEQENQIGQIRNIGLLSMALMGIGICIGSAGTDLAYKKCNNAEMISSAVEIYSNSSPRVRNRIREGIEAQDPESAKYLDRAEEYDFNSSLEVCNRQAEADSITESIIANGRVLLYLDMPDTSDFR